MVDGKAVHSFATKPGTDTKRGRRGERDADWCKKQYTVSDPNGEAATRTKKWFGFRLHLIADATYEMSVSFSVIRASESEQTGVQRQLEEMEKLHPEWISGCKYFLGDKGYDSAKIIRWLEGNGIAPVIDIRNCWQDGEEIHQYRDTRLVYDYKGDVWYVEDDEEKTELVYKGYNKGTNSQRYGFRPQKHDKRVFQIRYEEDRRSFTPVARNSHKWGRLYKKRTGVERINGRVDWGYIYEKHMIRGVDKMRMFITVTFLVFRDLAKGRIQAGEMEHLCRLYA